MPPPLSSSLVASIPFKGSFQTVPVAQPLWFENGVVYQAVVGAATSSWGVVGFQNLNAYTHYCATQSFQMVSPSAYPANSPFSAQDFPMSVVWFKQWNPPSPGILIAASQGATPYAAAVIGNVINNLKLGEFWSNQTPITTRVTWAQAKALAVQSTNGSQTVSLNYLLLIPNEITSGFGNNNSQNLEVFWTQYGSQFGSWGQYGNGTYVPG